MRILSHMKELLIISTLLIFCTNAVSQNFELVIPTGLVWGYPSSSDWGDFDNDGDLDILVTGWENGSPITRVLRNEGSDSFVEVEFALLNIPGGTAMWGDYNNDGYLDIMLTGRYDSDKGDIKIYTSDLGISFTEIGLDGNPGIIKSHPRKSSFVDFNNDGSYDIFVGDISSDGSHLYVNGNLKFDFSPIEIPPIVDFSSYFDWGDYDNDGDQDLLMNNLILQNEGLEFVQHTIAIYEYGPHDWVDYDNDGDLDILSENKLYRNVDGNFEPIEFTFEENGGTWYGDGGTSWGDYDNDGDLDLLYHINMYENLGNSSFVKHDYGFEYFYEYRNESPFDEGQILVDYDNDQDLDIFFIDRIYKNVTSEENKANTNIPINLTSTIGDTSVLFSWSQDVPDNIHSYNIYVKNQQHNLIVSPMSDTATGWRKVVREGNTGKNKFYRLNIKDLESGIYSWAVQSIDNRFLGSEFSEPAIIEINSQVLGIGSNRFDVSLKTHPNPVFDYLNINADPNINAEYSLRTLTGREVQSGVLSGSLEINMSNKPSGLYLIIFESGSARITRRIIKQ